jgi:hypothetical protein
MTPKTILDESEAGVGQRLPLRYIGSNVTFRTDLP